ncbi:MAG: penicillin-binding protein 2 [Solirubrobacterales bacterium]|nr:penicillin-binding protein 2 [Solirubrobacterales bacterium]
MAAIDRRVGFLFLGFLLLLGLALTRATYLGAFKAGSLQRAASTQQVVNVSIPATRGVISDRNGVQLALSESAAEVTADPYLIKEPLPVAQMLAPLLGQPVLTVLGKLTRPHTGYVVLAHQISSAQAQRIGSLRLGSAAIDGITTTPDVKRVYPLGWTASQLIGGVNDQGGDSGLEYADNRQLQGVNGERRVVDDARGEAISIDEVRQMKPGKSLTLTLDVALQNEVEQVLAGVGARYRPRRATAIVMNPNTGAILALANWPRVNANDPGASPAWADADFAVGQDFDYEPGSTFKAITVGGALQDGLIAPNTEFNIPPVLQVADRQIHDADPHGDETLSTAGILKYSSNIGADEIGLRLGADRFNDWVHRFGFGSPTGVDLPGEEGGIILPVSKYSGSSMGNLPFGQGESVTPIQIATAYAAIANGGILRAAHVVSSIGDKAVRPPAGHRILSPTTAAQLRQMLRGVFGDGGTASGAAIPGYDMAGKTGTANIAIHGRYSDSKYVASFVGMVPAHHPQLLGLVVVDEPQGSIYGGSVAAPAFQRIIGWAVPHYGIDPGR